jgi:hypothetical protein
MALVVSGQLDLRRVEHRVLVVGAQARFGRRELANVDAFERPAVRLRDPLQLALRLGQRHVQDALAASHAFEQELQCERRLARAGHAFDEVDAIGRQPAAQDFVETGDSGAVRRQNVGNRRAHAKVVMGSSAILMRFTRPPGLGVLKQRIHALNFGLRGARLARSED